jgi:hypothetical protein
MAAEFKLTCCQLALNIRERFQSCGIEAKKTRRIQASLFSTCCREGRFDTDCGGKREHGRDTALTQRDFRRIGISKRLCKVESGVAAALCHRSP